GSGSGEDYATIKYSGAGASLWTNRYHGPGYGDNAAAAMTVDASGNVVVTGYSYASNGYADYATIKYSNTGVPLWTNRYDGPAHNTEEAHAVGVDGGGNVFVTGQSWNGGSYGYATVKYSSAGQQLWVRRYDDSGGRAYALAVDGSGNVVVAGVSWSPNS